MTNPIEGRYQIEKINFHKDPVTLSVEETERLLRSGRRLLAKREAGEGLSFVARYIAHLCMGLRVSWDRASCIGRTLT